MHSILLLGLLITCSSCYPQWGAKLFYEFNRFNSLLVYDTFETDFLESKNGRMIGVGFDFYSSPRSFIGLDYAVDARTFSTAIYTNDFYELSLYDYASHSMNMRSGFIISRSADYSHLYSSISVGIRTFKESGAVEYFSSSSRRPFDEFKIGVPLGLRIGFRGTTEGQFMDIWLGLNVLATGSGMLNDEVVTPFSQIDQTALLWGVAYGFSGS